MAKKLYFYYSAMNAGKSTTLLQASYNYIERGMQTLIFAPSFDDRFKKNRPFILELAYTKKLSASMLLLTSLPMLGRRLIKELTMPVFLLMRRTFSQKKQVAELSEIATALNIATLTYGLRSDFQGEPFEGSRYLLAWAEEITEIKNNL